VADMAAIASSDNKTGRSIAKSTGQAVYSYCASRGIMKLISTRFKESEILMRFADDEDEKKAKEWIDVRVPINELKVNEGWLKKLDRDYGFQHGPAAKNMDEVDGGTIHEIKKVALEYAQAHLLAMSHRDVRSSFFLPGYFMA